MVINLSLSIGKSSARVPHVVTVSVTVVCYCVRCDGRCFKTEKKNIWEI